ncbi:hypothetical protein [Salmonella phage vB_StyS-sam]|uniref:Uncharacterized protein n=1 Tax=Salmonella phage vB_StyS-sam TaxID=2664131 RepID=A0A5K7YA69_9CAUD|nr:hypothetical protein QA026_gp24 [Salmonella phage vB_StyS-sam]BBO65977.1 hypothetical protein [Salmonella phage vB_StyS-sam]
MLIVQIRFFIVTIKKKAPKGAFFSLINITTVFP